MDKVETSQNEALELAFNSSPIYNAIFSCLSPQETFRMGRTCRLIRDAVVHFHALAYNVNRHLARFFNHPVSFRSLQAEKSFLISGSNALQFLDRTHYPESDLDIFTFPDSAKDVGRYLIAQEGYTFEPGQNQAKDMEDVVLSELQPWTGRMFRVTGSPHDEDYAVTGIADLLTFKKVNKNGETLKVQIIRGRQCPLDSVLHFHSTCVMNFIAWDAAYSLYPIATFEKRISIFFGTVYLPKDKAAVDKYTNRGWTIHEKLRPFETQAITEILVLEQPRYLNDRFTWVLPVDTSGIAGVDDQRTHSVSPELRPNPFGYNSWLMQRQFDGYLPHIRFGVFYQILRTPLMKGSYLMSDNGFAVMFDEYLEQQTEHEIEFLGKEGVAFAPKTATTWDSHIPVAHKMYMKLVEEGSVKIKPFTVDDPDNFHY